MFYYYKRIEPRSRLFLVGSARQVPRYRQLLDELVERLGLSDVVITGGVSHAALVAYYKRASAFVCMSEHEGFCAPLIEAIRCNVPVVAYDSSAVGETLDGAGVLVHEKEHEAIAELVHSVLRDEVLRSQLVEKQRRRLEHYAYARTSKCFMEAISGFLNHGK